MSELPEVLTDADNDEELLNDTDDFEPDVTVIDLVFPPSSYATEQELLVFLLKQQSYDKVAEDTSTH